MSLQDYMIATEPYKTKQFNCQLVENVFAGLLEKSEMSC
jgi:hypothetical protein